MNNEELKYVIEEEGLAYAIQDYLDPDRIEDIETKTLWLNAKEALDKLSRHLNLNDY